MPLLLNHGGLSCFLALLPRSFVLVRCLREENVAIFFARGLVEVDKHLFQMVSLVTSLIRPGMLLLEKSVTTFTSKRQTRIRTT